MYASLAGSLGETLEWTADRVDMRLRDIESHVRPHVADEPIPGWLAGHWFSEGQLAALQISAMITASVLLPWSRWRALLLDDPLQHADVIKVSAFADLIRALCADKQHQVIMTTHDRVQADFIAAKFLAGGALGQDHPVRAQPADAVRPAIAEGQLRIVGGRIGNRLPSNGLLRGSQQDLMNGDPRGLVDHEPDCLRDVGG